MPRLNVDIEEAQALERFYKAFHVVVRGYGPAESHSVENLHCVLVALFDGENLLTVRHILISNHT